MSALLRLSALRMQALALASEKCVRCDHTLRAHEPRFSQPDTTGCHGDMDRGGMVEWCDCPDFVEGE